MTKDIVINGISINTLAEQRKALQQGASKFLSDTIDQVKALVNRIINEEGADVDALAADALELLKAAKLVSNVSGVEYFLEYNEPYDGGNALSDELEGWADESGESIYGSGFIAKLYDQLQSMENDSYLWNSSSVHC